RSGEQCTLLSLLSTPTHPSDPTRVKGLEGGTIAGWRTADYLFSEDATCPDTLRIFESKDYLWNKVVVFHSLFLSACDKRQSVKSVCIGHYVLPPASVQDEVRQVVGRLIWECEDELSVTQVSTPVKIIYTKANHVSHFSWTAFCLTGFP
uniref:Uncharacterized protein n=1 Tax=Sander lucioperca TaxID=283035 RepID=A0A8C9YP00_SANLU